VAPAVATKVRPGWGRGALACALLACLLLLTATPAGASVHSLQAMVASARGKAGSLTSELQATQGDLAAAEGEAASAEAREKHLNALLATGEKRAARLAREAKATERHLAAERRRLHRARGALAARLVAIYESGSPDTANLILGSNDIEELAVRSEYLSRVEQSDSDLALRVAQVRREVARELKRVAVLKARVDSYNARLAAARAEVASVRQGAEATAAHLHSIEAARSAALATLKSEIGAWVDEIREAERISAEEAEATVERWLGGPYSIPTYVVMCESGGNYGAVNPSSGAGGAYQILPSTWQLYGGKGAPQDAPKAEQDRIAAEIWADSGASAWVCG